MDINQIIRKEEAKIIASAILNAGIQPAQKQAGSLFHIR